MCRMRVGHKNRDVKTAEGLARGRAKNKGEARRNEGAGFFALGAIWFLRQT